MKPSMPSSLRAFCTALVHLARPELLNTFLPEAYCFLLTTLPDLFNIRSFLVRPPLVRSVVPDHTRRLEPTTIFFLEEERRRDRRRERRFGALGVRARRAERFVEREVE